MEEKMGEDLRDYVEKTFHLTEDQIRAMTEEELDDLYEKACDNEEDVACRYDGEKSEQDEEYMKELGLAGDFTNWLAWET